MVRMMENQQTLYDVLNHSEVFNTSLERAYLVTISNPQYLSTNLINSMNKNERSVIYERLLNSDSVESIKNIFDDISNTDLYKILDDIKKEIDRYLQNIKIGYRQDYATTYLFFLNVADNFKIKDIGLQKQIDAHEKEAFINKIKMNLILRELAVIAYNKSLPYLSLNMYRLSELAMGQAMALNGQDIESLIKQTIHKEFSEYGREGGNSKGGNRIETKKRMLEYHDSMKKYTEKKENGKFAISAARAAREIASHFRQKHDIDCYEPTTLENIIREHRNKSHFTP